MIVVAVVVVGLLWGCCGVVVGLLWLLLIDGCYGVDCCVSLLLLYLPMCNGI